MGGEGKRGCGDAGIGEAGGEERSEERGAKSEERLSGVRGITGYIIGDQLRDICDTFADSEGGGVCLAASVSEQFG